jgi:2-(1,2-epoxy-1,2-dihydrophenyl)acetyl-CoA isomerase
VTTEDIRVARSGFVATVELNRPPNNHFDVELLTELADRLDELGDDPACRAVVLCSVGKHFCAGADFASRTRDGMVNVANLIYEQAVRLVAVRVPVVAAVQGSAVGGGLGVACVADFRVATPTTRFVANFARLGFHQGFGLTVTLPELVGWQRATEMLYTSARVDGTRALEIGLADRLVPAEELRAEAHRFAEAIAAGGPLAVAAIRATMRRGLTDRFRAGVEHELAEQTRLRQTEDFAEGIAASLARRDPEFQGR